MAGFLMGAWLTILIKTLHIFILICTYNVNSCQGINSTSGNNNNINGSGTNDGNKDGGSSKECNNANKNSKSKYVAIAYV